MKITHLAIAFLFGVTMISCQQSSTVSITTENDSISYVLGALQGQMMIQNFERVKIDSLVDMDLYLEGLKAGSTETNIKIDPDSNKMVLNVFFQRLQTSQMQAARDTTGTVQVYQPEKGLMDSISYILGADFGRGITKSFKENGLDTVLNLKLVFNAYVSAIKNEDLKIDAQQNRSMVDSFFQKFQEQQNMAKYGANKKEGEEFLAKNRGLEEITETPSGLQYQVLVEGHGPKPTLADKVKVNYTGSFIDGKVFDSSVKRGEPAVFGVGQVIKGWSEALQLMPVGSKWKLYIPYDIAYGEQGTRGIPPYSMLIFEVELLEIVK